MKKAVTRSALLMLTLAFFVSASGCKQLLAEIPFLQRAPVVTQPVAAPQMTPTEATKGTETPALAEDESNKIIIWLPPQFNPENGSLEGQLLKQRLQAFSENNPEVTFEVRIKALSGPGGLLDSLSTATRAAPAVLPGLLILPHIDLAAAANNGLIVPVEVGDDPAFQQENFAFAQDLTFVNGLNYGLPFAADVICMAYKSQQVVYPPVLWQEVIQLDKVMAFPAAETQGLTTLLLYLQKGGEFTQNDKQIILDEEALQQTLMFLAEGATSDVFPYWLADSTTFDESWQTVLDARATYAVIRASQYLAERPENIAITSLPTFNGEHISLTEGWVLAFPPSSPEHFDLYLQLAAYLVEPEFQAKWTESAGLLPVNSAALSLWKNSEVSGILLEMAENARLSPSAQIISRVGPLFAQATIETIRKQTTYIESTNKVIKSLSEGTPEN